MAQKSKAKNLAWPIAIIGAIGGGYLDLDNNTRDPSTEHSNPDVVKQYESQIATLSELKASNAPRDVLSQKSIEFFGSTYANNQLSEADVASLTAQFSAQVAPPSTLAGGYVLEHPEYLDEAKADIKSRNLGALDQKTMDMHKENYDDGPGLGATIGFFGFGTALQLTFAMLILVGGATGASVSVTARGAKKLAETAKKAIKPKPKHGNH